MGTNYYLHKKPTEEELISLKDIIDETADGTHFTEVLSAAHLLFDQPESNDIDSIEGWGKLHIGKRSAGWKFDWCPNIIRMNLSYINENHDFVDKYEYRLRYPLTKQGITDYIMRDDIVVIDEYGAVQDKNEFLEMAFSWYPDGMDSLSEGASTCDWDFSREQAPFKELGFTFKNPGQSDFISDGLRFSIFDDFS